MAQLALLVLRVLAVLTDTSVPMELQALLVREAQQARQEPQVRLELLARLEHRAHKETRVFRVTRASKGRLVLQVLSGLRVPQVLKVFRVSQDPQALRE